MRLVQISHLIIFSLCTVLLLASDLHEVSSSSLHQVYIIVPGTWAGTTGWHSVGGDFFHALEKAITNPTASIVTFWWSGKNTYTAREHAAQALTRLLISYPDTTQKIIIAHSHGTNVALLAAQYLAQEYPATHIAILYAFATPVEYTTYIPNMHSIDHLYHFFSFSDYIQVAWGLFGRLFCTHERIRNISVTINQKEPDHSTIHAPCIAQHLPQLPFLLQEQQFDWSKPAHIDFFDDKPPQYYINTQLAQQLEFDEYVIQSLINAIRSIQEPCHA